MFAVVTCDQQSLLSLLLLPRAQTVVSIFNNTVFFHQGVYVCGHNALQAL